VLILAGTGFAQAQSIAVHWSNYYTTSGTTNSADSSIPPGTADGIQLPDGSYNANWTNIQAGWYGVASNNNTNLQDSTGAPTTAAVTSTATNGGTYWYVNPPIPGVDNLLAGAWGGNGAVPNAITGIPYSNYEIIAYTNPNMPYGGNFSAWLDGLPANGNALDAPLPDSQYYFSPTGSNPGFVLMTNNSDSTSYPAQNTVVWTGLSGPNQVLWTQGYGGSNNYGFTGFEIVNTPMNPPPTWAVGNGNWSNAANWTGGPPLPPSADGATAAINVSTAAPVTITLDVPQTIGTLLLGSGVPGVGYTLSGSGSNTLTFSNTSNHTFAQISVTDGAHVINAPVVLDSNLFVTQSQSSSTAWTLTFGTASSITDNGAGYSLTMYAPNGTLILSGQNTYTGATILIAGVVNLGAPENGTSGPLGESGPIVFNGGMLQYSAVNQYDYSSRFSTAANQAYNVDTNGQNVTWAAALASSGGSLTKFGDGLLTLTSTSSNLAAANVNGGAVTLSGGTIGVFNHNTGAGTSTIGAGVTVGTINVNDGTVNFNSTQANGILALPAGSTGTVIVGPATGGLLPTVNTADFSNTPATGTVNAANPLAITSTLKLPGGTSATLTNGTSFTATGANLASPSVPSTLGFGGGTLTLASPQQMIGVHWSDYGGNNPSPITGTDGVIPQGNWNNVSANWYSGGASNLIDNRGATTTAAVGNQATGSGTYWAADGPVAGLSNLLVGPRGGNGPMANVITGIPYANYEIIAYVNEPYAANISTWLDSVPSTPNATDPPATGTQYYFSPTLQAPGFVQITNQTAGTYPAGNYVVFSGLSGSAQTVWLNGNNNNAIYGFQVVDSAPDYVYLPATAISVTSSSTLDLGETGTPSLYHTLGSLSLTAGTASSTRLQLQNGLNINFNGISAIYPTGGTGAATASIVNGSTAPLISLASGSTVSVDPNVTLTIGSAIGDPQSGVTTLTMTGAGTLVLSGSNTYTGGTTVGSGVLTFLNKASQPVSGTTTVAAGATLGFGVGTTPSYFGSTDLDAVFNGTMPNVTMAANSNVGIDTTAGNFIYNTSISATSLGLTKLGSNILVLTGTNTYTGGTTVSSGVLTFLKKASQPVSGTTTVAAGATLGFGVGTTPTYFGSTDLDAVFKGTMPNVTMAANSNVGIDTTAGDFTYNTSISTTSLGLTKLGANTLTLTGSNSYAGGTTVSSGTLQIGNSAVLGTGGLTVGNGGTVDLNGISPKGLPSLSGAPGAVITDNSVPAVPSSATILAVDIASGSCTYAGAITTGANAQGIALSKAGNGTLVLSGTDNYTGGTTVRDGTLVITSDTAIAGGTSLTVAAGGTFVFDPSLAGSPVSGGQVLAASSAGTVSAVPEPGTLALLIAGLAAGFGIWRKSRA